MVLNLFLPIHLYLDLFDRRVLEVLRDEGPRGFHQLLGEVGFSHNTLRRHLRHLENKGLVVREKIPLRGRGRPRFAYSMPPQLRRRVSPILSDPSVEVVTITFSRLRHACRFEKGGRCKKARGACKAQSCPLILKRE